jgi:hypothetical protein
MTFYSGFGFDTKSRWFEPWLDHSDYCIAGFSYGAIKATQAVANATHRVDRLQLFSPAFFQTHSEGFKRLQRKGYRHDPVSYMQTFTQQCFAPYAVPDGVVNTATDAKDLETLLAHEWSAEQFEAIVARGVTIDVYLGGQDQIIDASGARAWFTQYATVYWFTHANHFLQER